MVLIISISEGQVVRNLLENSLIDILLLKFPSLKIIILSPAYNIPEFKSKWNFDGKVTHDKLLPFAKCSNDKRIAHVRRKLSKVGLKSLSRLFIGLERYKKSREHDYYLKYLKDNMGDTTLLLTTHIHLPIEAPLLSAAKELNIASLGIVNSWDNVVKGIEAHPDNVLVWNDINKEQMCVLEGYKKEYVKTIGAPAFDPYFNQKNIVPREKFCQEYGFDPERPIILYATIGQYVPFFEETNILDNLLDIFKNYKLSERPQIICRLHPWSKKELFKNYSSSKNLVYSSYNNYTPTLGWTPTLREVIDASNLLYHSDICITPGSTMVLESAIFDTPLIVPTFNDFQPEVWKKYYSEMGFFKHAGKLVKNNLVPIVRSRSELEKWINNYLESPNLFSKERRTIVDNYIKYKDGKSISRLFEVIISYYN